MTLTSKQRITKMIEKWYLIEPLYFAVWTTHELVINPTISNIRVGRGKVEYNPSFIESLSDKELYTVLTFEAMRILLKHPYSRRREIPQLSYEASSITIQEYLRTSLNFPIAYQVFNTHEFDQKYFEFYYFKLLELAEKNAILSDNTDESITSAASTKTQLGGSSQSTTHTPTDTDTGPETNASDDAVSGEHDQQRPLTNYTTADKSGRENTEYWDDDKFTTEIINEKINMAMESDRWGNIPSYVQEKIIGTLKPKLNYRQILKSFRGTILSVNRVLTRMKPSRRYGFLCMGSRRDFCTKLLFAVDVSGSISNIDLRKAFSVINQLFKYGIEIVDVIQFDTEIKGEPISLKKARHKVKVMGRGGTSFQPVMDYIDHHKSYDGLIIYTDGYADIPKPPVNKRTRVIWLFNHENNYDRMQEKLKHIGKAAFIKES
ncbi:MAG: hypothetical protein HQK77_16725 [Desulfobacterales bacterium]|nr:hypothetical protein [Desulfobacterales bacterium]